MSAPSKTLVVANPASGGGRGRRRAAEALRLLPDAELKWTEGPAHATSIVETAWDAGFRRFVVLGGDGTVFEVVCGLFARPREERPVLGIVPIGTGNSFVRDFGLLTPDDAIAAIGRGSSRRCDVVRLEHAGGVLHFVNLLSLGFSAEAGRLTNRRFKPLGLGGYAVSVVIGVARLKAPVIRWQPDGGEVVARPTTLLSFCNSRFTGGTMQMAPGADVSDGLVDVIDVGAMSRRRLLSCFPRIYRGTHVEMAETRVSRAATVSFPAGDPVDVMVDGEVLRLAPTRLAVLPGALEFLA